MTMDRERAAFVASRRFGLGAAPGEIERYRADPRGAVLAQLDPAAARLADPQLVSSAEALRRVWDEVERVKKLRESGTLQPAGFPQAQGSAPPASATSSERTRPTTGGAATAPAAPMTQPPSIEMQIFQVEFTARLGRQISTTTPFVERLVNFWSNHFCIAVDKNGAVRASAGAYEREVIRPFVLGRFRDMLMASAHHPAMLMYLDNTVSVGPRSTNGLRTNKGLNENLGREILELHTLGVDGGYSQADVTAFSTALTGWSASYVLLKGVEPGKFHFFPDRHEPGSVRILGKDYDQNGPAQAEEALEDFARHPATARHMGRKLVRHFVGDDAPAGLADRLAAVFHDTDGDLMAVSRALAEADETWSAPPAKVLSPWDFLIATGRMLGIDWSYGEATRMLNLFGQPLWNVPFPQGWPDDDEAWAASASLLELLDAVAALARRNGGDRNVARLADETLGSFLHPQTRRTVARAETPELALTLLLMSPDFLRR